MRRRTFLYVKRLFKIWFLLTFCISKTNAQVIANFTTPDTVCVNTPVTVTNTSIGASTYYWNFCTADINSAPAGTNIGDVGNALQTPVYIDYTLVNGNYYGFVTNNFPGKLLRLDFGNSLLNAPTVTDLGTINGAIPNNTEGVQIAENNGQWFLIIVGGDITDGVTPSVVTVQLGSNIANNTPTATNWGDLGNLAYPHDLYVFQDNGHWYGITVNTSNSTVTRFDFTTSFLNTPTAVNLGNVGNLNSPTGIQAIKNPTDNNWYVFVTNAGSSTLSRLNFGASLLNTPTGINLGNVGGTFNLCWDIYILNYCGNSIAYVINAGDNTLVNLNFNGDFLNFPTATNFGNIGNLSFPHCLSKLFRVGADVYSLINNVNNNTITRLKFSGCNNASIPNSTAINPPAITYNTPGIYNISLDVDDGLPTQTAFCRQVVVVPSPQKKPLFDTMFCSSASVLLKDNFDFNSQSYLWNTGATESLISVNKSGIYWVQGSYYQCMVRDSFAIQQNPLPAIFLGNDTGLCPNAKIILNAGNNGSSYLWQNNSTYQKDTASSAGTYFVKVTDANKCVNSDTIKIVQYSAPAIALQNTDNICKGISVQLVASSAGSNTYLWSPSTGLSNTGIYNPLASPSDTTKYFVTVTNMNKCSAKDSVTVDVLPVPLLNNLADTNICKGASVQLNAGSYAGNSYIWNPSTGLSNAGIYNPLATPADSIKYFVTVTGSNKCISKDSVLINVLSVPVLSKLNDTNICRGSSVQLFENVQGANTFHWSPSSGLSNPNIYNPVASPSDTTKYFITVSGGDKCAAKDSVLINVLQLPVLSAVNDTSICKGYSVQLIANASGNNSFLWNPSNGLSNLHIYNPVASPSDTTKYSVTVTGINKCFSKDSLTVNVLPDPLIKKIPDTAICKSASVLLNPQPQYAYIFQWQPATGLNNPKIYDPTAIVSSSIQYIFTAGNKFCSVNDTVNINVLPLPVLSISNDTTICGTAKAQLFSSGGINYTWTPSTGLSNPNIYNPVASPNVTTRYIVLVKNEDQCASKDSVLITVSPKPNFSITPSPIKICAGDTTLLNAFGGDSYVWLNNGNVIGVDSFINVSPSANNSYEVAVSSIACKVTDTLSAQVLINPNPSVSVMKSNDVNCVIGITNLSAFGGTYYSWSPQTSLSNPFISNPVATPPATTMYYVTVKDGNNCTSTDSILVNFDKGDAQNGYLVPSAFTPNGDGKNDCFSVKEWGNVSSFDLSIYNRWGNLVFHAENNGECWDGTYKGIQEPAGTYVYQIKGQAACGEIYRKGTLVLIR